MHYQDITEAWSILEKRKELEKEKKRDIIWIFIGDTGEGILRNFQK